MNLEELERRMIREAQRELAPAPATRQRHEQALLEQLARGMPLGGQGSGPAAALGERSPVAAAPWLGFSGLPGRMLGVGLAVGVLVGGWLGYSFGRGGSGAAREATPPEASIPSGPVSGGPAVLEPSAAEVPSEPARPAAPAPSAIVASAATELGGSGAGRPPKRAARAHARGGESSLAEELAMLQRARRAIGAGNGQLALGIVLELDERFPRGVLMEERLATRVFSLCALSREAEAREVAREFLAQHPTSVYAERVRRSCIGTSE